VDFRINWTFTLAQETNGLLCYKDGTGTNGFLSYKGYNIVSLNETSRTLIQVVCREYYFPMNALSQVVRGFENNLL